MVTKAKRELSDEELARQKDGDNASTRYWEKGSIQQINGASLKVIDKVIYPINECPHCNSKATFHRRIQEGGDIAGNVWRDWQTKGPKGYAYMKFDFCLDCHKEFLIELYVFEEIR